MLFANTALVEVLMHGVGSASVEDAHNQSRRGDVLLKQNGGMLYATTKQVHREEVEMVTFVREGRGACKKLAGSTLSLDAGLSQNNGKPLRRF